MHELRGEPELTLGEALSRLAPCDLVLVEGFKTAPIPKLAVWRPSVGKPLLHPSDPAVRAVATDEPAALAGCPLRILSLDDVDEIATVVLMEAGSSPVSD